MLLISGDGPFSGIAEHVVKTKRTGMLFGDRVRLIRGVFLCPRNAVGDFKLSGTGAAGVFPFRGRGQAIFTTGPFAQPLAIHFACVSRNRDYRVTRVPKVAVWGVIWLAGT